METPRQKHRRRQRQYLSTLQAVTELRAVVRGHRTTYRAVSRYVQAQMPTRSVHEEVQAEATRLRDLKEVARSNFQDAQHRLKDMNRQLRRELTAMKAARFP